MKTQKTDNIKLGPKAKEDIIKQQIKSGKAQAVPYSDAEAKSVAEMKLEEHRKELIDSQKAYRIKVKERILKELELEEMKRQIDSGNPICMQWYGMPYPINILKATYNLGIESLILKKNDEQELYKKLVDLKLTEDEIKGVIDGEYVKEPRTA